jgi:hypothetical protein
VEGAGGTGGVVEGAREQAIRRATIEECARLCDTEAEACLGDIVPGDEIGRREANARAGALLTVAHDIRSKMD